MAYLQRASIPVSIYVKVIKIHQDIHKCTATFFESQCI